MKAWLFQKMIDLIVLLAAVTPVRKNRVVFCSYGGRGIGSDPGKIALAMLAHSDGLDLVWMLKDLKTPLPDGLRKCRIYDRSKSIFGQIVALFRSSRMFSSAKVVICDAKDCGFFKHRASLYIQTWHGDMPFKLIEGECTEELESGYLLNSRRDSARTDVILSASSFMSDIFRRFFWLPEDCRIMEFGIPRNDIYFSDGTAARAAVELFFGLEAGVRLAVYAPTFRDDGDTTVFNSLDFGSLLKALSSRFGGKWKILVRMHPNINAAKCTIAYGDDVLNASGFADGESLFKSAEILITDASSIIREFITMEKPVFMYFPDFEHYAASCRSLRPLFFKLPFRRCRNTTELVSEISAYQQQMYQGKVEEFMKANVIRFFDDGHATERAVKLIYDHLSE